MRKLENVLINQLIKIRIQTVKDNEFMVIKKINPAWFADLRIIAVYRKSPITSICCVAGNISIIVNRPNL
jgi:hypothetical protein